MFSTACEKFLRRWKWIWIWEVASLVPGAVQMPVVFTVVKVEAAAAAAHG